MRAQGSISRTTVGRTFVGAVGIALLPMSGLASEPLGDDSSAMSLEVDDFVGTIRILKSDTDHLKIISIIDGANDLGGVSLEREEPGRIKMRGAPAPLSMNCARTNGDLSVSFDNGRMRPISDFPSVVVSVPSTADVKLSLRAGDAEIDDTENLEILAGGCSSIIANNVGDTLRLTTTGSARLELASAGRADIDANNGGSIHIEQVRRLLNACLGKTSRLSSNGVSGSAEVYQSGASRAQLNGVKLTELVAELDGSSVMQVSGAAASSRMTVGASAQAKISKGIKLGTIDLQRAGRLIIDGERWKGPSR
jgi:hypothetical protein